ncbi:MAG: prepilin peptidase [Candidatus Pacearchaeota archaeon]
MFEVIFLIVLALIWIVFASVQDLKHREVANWLSFSLIVFAVGFRFFWSLFSPNSNFMFFYQGLIGLGIFFVIGNLFYYSRLFAGGDAKLMIALGPVLGFSSNFLTNLKIYFIFLIVYLFAGMFYGIFWSLSLMLRNFKSFKKEFTKLFYKNSRLVLLVSFIGMVLVFFGFIDLIFSYFGFLILIIPYVYLFAKAIDEACMIKNVKVSELVEGDWLYKDVKIGRKLIKANWDGLSKEDIKLLRKKKKSVLIRQGIPFVPVFLIAFLILIYIWFYRISFGFCFLN